MEESRRAYIKQQAAVKKKAEGSLPPKAMSQAKPSTKRKPSKKVDCQAKKPKVVMGSIVGETSHLAKLPPKSSPGKRKGLMVDQGPVKEKPPILLRKDSQHALKQITSIIKGKDYEDLGNHAIEAMGETGLFNLTQVLLSH